jgi:hypothetical protein
MGSDADDIDLAIGQLCDHRTDLRGADVQPNH